MLSMRQLFPGEDRPFRQQKTASKSTEAARVGIVAEARTSPSDAAAIALFPAGEAPVLVPTRSQFDSDIEKMAGLGWNPTGRASASELDISPEEDNGSGPGPIVKQKKLAAIDAESWTIPKMDGSLANCSIESATYTPSEAAGSKVEGSVAKKGVSSRGDGSNKRAPSEYEDDVNALLIELGVYVSEGGHSSK